MTHLSPEELVDIAEGARPHHAHLDSCNTCRLEVAEMRSLMDAVADVAVPDPSPLFWDHLSSRVHDAVAVEARPQETRLDRWGWVLNVWSWRLAVPVAALAAAAIVVVAVLVSSHGWTFSTSPEPVQQAVATFTVPDGDSLAEPAADPSFNFVADLTIDMDMDTAIEAGLVSDGSAEHAVTHLNEGELRELAKLLTEEIAHGQAS